MHTSSELWMLFLTMPSAWQVHWESDPSNTSSQGQHIPVPPTFFFFFGGILVLWPGIEPSPQQRKYGVLTTRPPRMSLFQCIYTFSFLVPFLRWSWQVKFCPHWFSCCCKIHPRLDMQNVRILSRFSPNLSFYKWQVRPREVKVQTSDDTFKSRNSLFPAQSIFHYTRLWWLFWSLNFFIYKIE